MNIYLILIAALGCLWIFVCVHQGTKKWLKKHPRIRKILKKISPNVFIRDAIISIIIISITSIIFVGVTGMIIGLAVSVLVSIYLWLAMIGVKNE